MNTYYRYRKQSEFTNSEISLTATEGDNKIILMITEDHNTLPGRHATNITLTEQEQDDLIAGILERRGISLDWEVRNNRIDSYGNILPLGPISATGNEQSKIHPANKNNV